MRVHEQEDFSVLDDSIASGDVDLLCHSKKPMPSMDQPVYGSYAFTVAVKLTWDDGLLKLINVAR